MKNKINKKSPKSFWYVFTKVFLAFVLVTGLVIFIKFLPKFYDADLSQGKISKAFEIEQKDGISTQVISGTITSGKFSNAEFSTTVIFDKGFKRPLIEGETVLLKVTETDSLVLTQFHDYSRLNVLLFLIAPILIMLIAILDLKKLFTLFISILYFISSYLIFDRVERNLNYILLVFISIFYFLSTGLLFLKNIKLAAVYFISIIFSLLMGLFVFFVFSLILFTTPFISNVSRFSFEKYDASLELMIFSIVLVSQGVLMNFIFNIIRYIEKKVKKGLFSGFLDYMNKSTKKGRAVLSRTILSLSFIFFGLFIANIFFVESSESRIDLLNSSWFSLLVLCILVIILELIFLIVFTPLITYIFLSLHKKIGEKTIPKDKKKFSYFKNS